MRFFETSVIVGVLACQTAFVGADGNKIAGVSLRDASTAKIQVKKLSDKKSISKKKEQQQKKKSNLQKPDLSLSSFKHLQEIKRVNKTIAMIGGRNLQGICTVCPDGSSPGGSSLLAFSGIQCGELDSVLASEGVAAGTDTCDFVQEYAAYCECPGVNFDFCNLCLNGSPPSNPDLEAAEDGNGDPLTCQEVTDILKTYPASDSTCIGLQDGLQDMCGCSTSPVSQPTRPPTPAPTEPAGAPCTLCPDGSSPDFPNVVIRTVDGVDFTCADIEQEASDLTDMESGCNDIRSVLPGICGCGFGPTVSPTMAPQPTSPVEDSVCTLCADGSASPTPDFLIQDLGTTCGELEATTATYQKGSTECTTAILTYANLCNCPSGSAAVIPGSAAAALLAVLVCLVVEGI